MGQAAVNLLPTSGWHFEVMTSSLALFWQFLRDQRGSVPVEYGMIAVLVSVVAVAVITNIGTSTNLNFNSIIAGLK
ncbi:MAG: Flp family type IVb pilin [Bosea sp. (in: a-proteobacteria)]